MLYQRDGVDVSVNCPKESDCRNGLLRLRRPCSTLANSTKFVHSGFIRFRAAVVDGVVVEVYVEDSGPGIPIKSKELCLKVPAAWTY
jgi:hypothetical protein